MWMSMTDGERLEMYQSLDFSEQRARKNGTLATDAQQLAGSAVPHDATLQGMMGELCEAHATRQTARREERLEMKAAEMADADIEVVLENKYKTDTQGDYRALLAAYFTNCWTGFVNILITSEKVFLS